MGKRKRVTAEEEAREAPNGFNEKTEPASFPSAMAAHQSTATTFNHDRTLTLQVVVGSYERILHGLTATIGTTDDASRTSKKRRVEFADTFLFNAHASAIRCLAVSPMQPDDGGSGTRKVVLASGSTDERINLYQLSASPPPPEEGQMLPPAVGNHPVMENPTNRELGSLLHHSACVTRLCFPTRSKLLSSAEDNTIAVTRTRDWTALSTIKAPLPRAHGRPSGDTAPAGGTPAGINDFAVHPSRKVMLSVSRGERCMRLWNLMTGKKAGVLKFDKEWLQSLGEGKWSGGEGRTLDWNMTGEEFVVGFERGAVVYSIDCKPQCRVMPVPTTKMHQIRYLQPSGVSMDPNQRNSPRHVLAASTEDGRIIFFSSSQHGADHVDGTPSTTVVPSAPVLGEMGGQAVGMQGRIKDFMVLPRPTNEDGSDDGRLLIVTGSSDGVIRLWEVSTSELLRNPARPSQKHTQDDGATVVEKNGLHDNASSPPRQVGQLVGTYETHLRITCLTAFIMANPGPRTHEEGPQDDPRSETSGVEKARAVDDG